MKDNVQFKFNVPVDVKHWLEKQARANIRSQGAEVVAILSAEMDRTKLTEKGESDGRPQTRSRE